MRRTTRPLGDQPDSDGLEKLQPGITLQERYLILGMLGSGGMSSVYKGRDLHFPNVTRLVAIKEMVNLIADDPGGRSRTTERRPARHPLASLNPHNLR